MAEKGWRRTFDDPIPLPDGRKLVTLHDAATYIRKLPKREHDAPEWQAAIEALMLVAERGGPTMLARIGHARLERSSVIDRLHVQLVFNHDQSGRHHRALSRDQPLRRQLGAYARRLSRLSRSSDPQRRGWARDDADALGHAATTTNRRPAGHEHPQYVIAALAHLVEAGAPMLGASQ
jgi:hypothetical protein